MAILDGISFWLRARALMDAKAVDQAEGGTVEMGLAPGKQQGFWGSSSFSRTCGRDLG